MFVAGSLTRRATPQKAVAVLRELDADVVGIPEFGILDRMDTHTKHEIEALGYALYTTAYGDKRYPGYGSALLSRMDETDVEHYSLGDEFRDALVATVTDKKGRKIRICSLYLDDRTDASRVNQISHFVTRLKKSNLPTIVMGDFNTMDERSMMARFVRLSILLMMERAARGYFLTILQRLRMMASGSSLRYLTEHTTLRDLDPKHQLTISAKQAGYEWLPSVRLAKLDWIFASSEFSAQAYRVWRDVGSDHRPVRAELEY